MGNVSCDGDNILGNPLSLTCQDDTYHPHPKPVNPIEVGSLHSISQLTQDNGFHSRVSVYRAAYLWFGPKPQKMLMQVCDTCQTRDHNDDLVL